MACIRITKITFTRQNSADQWYRILKNHNRIQKKFINLDLQIWWNGKKKKKERNLHRIIFLFFYVDWPNSFLSHFSSSSSSSSSFATTCFRFFPRHRNQLYDVHRSVIHVFFLRYLSCISINERWLYNYVIRIGQSSHPSLETMGTVHSKHRLVSFKLIWCVINHQYRCHMLLEA